MTWKKRKRVYKGKNDSYSLSRKLRKENRSDDIFEVKLNNLSLEEVIALKLELASNSTGKALYGLPLWQSLTDIVQDGMLRYALSATRTKGEAMRLLGLTSKDFKRLNKKFHTDTYFEDDNSNRIFEKLSNDES
jgi:hypothetical protein